MGNNFLGGAYKLTSLPLAAQTCVNLYPEANESGVGDVGAFRRTPGLRWVATLPSLGCRALHTASGSLWAVYGASVYKIALDGTFTSMGEIGSLTGPVSIAHNPTHVIIAHLDGWHAVNIAEGKMNQIDDAPKGADVSFIDNYIVGAELNGTYKWATVGTIKVDPLNFASAEGDPDFVIRTVSDHRELWLFGENSVEVSVVTSDPDLPFTRTSYIEQGLLAKSSACKIDNQVYWLGKSRYGHGVVYAADGYVPMRVSTLAIEQAIASYSEPSTCTAYTYQQDGHHFYVLNFAEATWVYDINTKEWHQRAYRNQKTGQVGRHRSNCHAILGYTHYVGDFEDGRLYALDPNFYTDDGEAIYWERTWRQDNSEGKRVQYMRGELFADTGESYDGWNAQPVNELPPSREVSISVEEPARELRVNDMWNPSVWLSWSDDGGRTWSSSEERTLGQRGEYRHRVVWRRLGSSEMRYFRLRGSSNTPITLRGFHLDARKLKR